MIRVRFLNLAIAATLGVPAFAADCDLAFLQSQCAQMKGVPGKKLKLGEVEFFNPAKSAIKAIENAKPRLSAKAQEAKFKRMFASIQEEILAEILQGRKPEDLPENQFSMYERIRTVKPGGVLNTSCGANPGGQYTRERHSLSICPGTFEFPDAVAIGILSHEFSHAIDPCASCLPILDVDVKKALKFDGSRKFKTEVANIRPRNNLFTDMVNSQGQGAFWQWTQLDRAHFRYMAESGFIKGVAIKPVQPEDYPFKDAVACLAENGIKDVTAANYKEFLKTAPIENDEQRKVFERHAAQAPGCSLRIKGVISPQSEMAEMLGDLWKAKITGKYLGPQATADEARAAMANELFHICQPESFPHKDKPDGFGVTKHPAWNTRTLNSMLRDSNIAKALGCEIPKGSSCIPKLTQGMRSSPPDEAPGGDSTGAIPERLGP